MAADSPGAWPVRAPSHHATRLPAAGGPPPRARKTEGPSVSQTRRGLRGHTLGDPVEGLDAESEVCPSAAHLPSGGILPCAPILQRRRLRPREKEAIGALSLQLAGDRATRGAACLPGRGPASLLSCLPDLSPGRRVPLSVRQDHGELSGMQVAETHTRRRVLSELPRRPQGGLGPCTPGPQPPLCPVLPRPGSSGSTPRLPCCSLGTHRGSGSGDWPVSRPRFRFLGERRGPAQLGWGESFPPCPWQAVSRGAAAVRTRLRDPLGPGDPGLPAAGGGSHMAFSCDGPVNGTTRMLRVGAGLWLSQWD